MRILCSCLPAFGHFNPIVPVARSLASRGHEVAFATGDDLCPRVEEVGFKAFPAGLRFADALRRAQERFPEEASLPLGAERFTTFVPRMLADVVAPARADDLLGVVQRWQPDVLIHDEAELAGPMVAAAASIPWATQSISVRRPLSMATLADELLAPHAESLGVDVHPFAGLFRYLYLNASPPSLAAPHLNDVAVNHPARAVNPDVARDDRLPGWVDALPPVPTVLVSLGTVFNRDPDAFRAILDGLKDRDLNVIVTVGFESDPAALGPQPANVHCERYVPLSLLLPYLDLVVTNGAGTTLLALGRGLPLLLLPKGADNFHTAEACVSSGAARCLLPEDVTAEAVAREVRALLEEAPYRVAAERIATEIRGMPGPDAAAGLIERLARERRPLERAPVAAANSTTGDGE